MPVNRGFRKNGKTSTGNYVNNLPENQNIPDGQWIFGTYKGVRVGIIKKDGITTIIPDNSRQP